MRGSNLFYQHYQFTAKSACPSLCVFISHKSEDKPMARAVAEALLDMEVDIYFDERDVILQGAAAAGHDEAIVKCINNGLDHCTHLLGLITKNTFKSWWVPYEIGGAQGRRRTCGHLVAKDVNDLPSYVKVAPLVLDIDGLAEWVRKIRPISLSKDIIKGKITSQTKMFMQSYVPEYRSSTNITFS